MSFGRLLRRMPWWVTIITAAIFVVLVAILDIVTGEETNLTIFYLLPIFLATWYVGKRAGVLFSVLCAATWFMVEVTANGGNPRSSIPIFNTFVGLGFFLLVTFLLSGLRSAYAREKILARTDSLTGVVNTKYFYYLAGQEIERAGRYIHPFSVAYMDLDNFKEVNDCFGHDAGDDVLRLVTSTISNNIRKTDIIARLGGDEFILLFPETGAEDAGVVMEKLKELLLHNMQERQRPVTFSIGLVTYITAPESVEDMVKEADRLMYTVKNSTKNAIGQEIL